MRRGKQDWHEEREDGRTTRRIPAAGVERHESGGESAGRAFAGDVQAARIRRTVQRRWRQLGFRRQFVMLLVAATLLSTLGTVIAAYFGARSVALDSAQARVTREVRVAGEVLAMHGQNISVRDGQLYTDGGFRLNGDSQLAGQISNMTGDGAAVYQVEGQQLIGVAGNLGDGGNAVMGDTLTGAAYQALLGGCPTSSPASIVCQHSYRGVVTIHGTAYVAAFAPLRSAQGNAVGALAVATPLDSIEAPLRVLAGVLLLIGLTLTGGFIIAGYRISGPVSHRAFTTLRDGLDDIGGGAGQVGRLAHTMSVRSTRQQATARQLLNEVRMLDEAAQALGQGISILRDATGQLWAEMSYPGAAPSAGSRTARQVAVAASQIGGASDQATAVCQSLRARMNQIIAEAGLLADGGREAELRARELGAALEHIEAALGSRGMLPVSGRTGSSLPTPSELVRGTNRLPAVPPNAGETGATPAAGGPKGGGASWPDGRLRWTGGDPTAGHMSHAPRAGQPERPGPHPNLNGSGYFRAVPRPSNPDQRLSRGHPGTSGRERTPWFSDEQDLGGTLPRDPGPAGASGPSGAFGAHRLPDVGGVQPGAPRDPGPGQPGAPGPRAPESGDPSQPPRGGSHPTPRPRPSDWMNDLR